MKKTQLTLIMMTSMLLANQQNLTLSPKINDETIKVKLSELGFCTSSTNVTKIKQYMSANTGVVELEELILEHI